MLNEIEQLWPKSLMVDRAIRVAYQYAMQYKKKKYDPIGRTSWDGVMAKQQIQEADDWINAKMREWGKAGKIGPDGEVMLESGKYSPTHPDKIAQLFNLSRDEAKKLFHPVVLKNINEVT